MICVNHILSGKPAVYSLSIRALMRWLPPSAPSLHVKVLTPGLEYPPQQLILDLVNMGFEGNTRWERCSRWHGGAGSWISSVRPT